MRMPQQIQAPDHRVSILVTMALLAAALAGCGDSSGGGPRSASSIAHRGDRDDQLERIKDAIAFLNEGRPDQARPALIRALLEQPGNALARNLLQQIDSDPKVLLGKTNYRYSVKDGETMSVIAQRFLGDPMLSYALARYNGLTSPQQLRAGQEILIPGKPKLPGSVMTKKAGSLPSAKKPTAPTKTAPPTKATEAATDPAEAARLRGQGLAALNAGAVNRAVSLLRRAQAFDPGNSVIKGDLARALRIQGTLTLSKK